MILPFAIPSFVSSALGALSKVPWQIWAGLAFVAVVGASYCAGKSNERERWEHRLEAMAAEARANAAKATDSANAEERERVTEFEAQQDILKETIDEANRDGTNALDGLFSSLSEAD